ncbi:MAG: cytochrome c biogenesis protein CcsA, partial [Thiotrichales bacterium]|nr:cytochrome c biogenesis protein CcsA [Thiotrichales bacterium]
DLSLGLHILLSIAAYSLLSIAALQAILLAIQEYHFRHKKVVRILNILPPIKVMEDVLFGMIASGFFCLSLSLVSGMMFIHDLLAQHLVHKTVLSVLAWIIFGIVLWGRWSLGWRGPTAIRWTLGGFVTLMLAYFGTKLVLEIILNKV